ncbi:isocitrate/isopropylmalate dehydrogenase family protein [Oribacterium sp. WCC10]|uniref:isocitrate/isopropylmalate dehydrogenase family protein n=1 Tax=Oribacterium sp. WCC10 TaxID=1855343 RepID=UPI0008E635FA|nr:isocitrate/isopropylmalate dehydrogenase family protein [Oribacterium sp. WCC10]SFG53180.1 isocitrate dehydrogenase (NAD+) [Oribacterium sp. WCC10]
MRAAENKAVKTVTFFRGDGIGPEISDSVFAIFQAAHVPVKFEIFDVGEAEYNRNGKLIPDDAFTSFEKTKVLLKSPITTPVGKGFRSLNVTMRKKYDLYANFRPAKSNSAVPTPFPNTDIVTFRENTEDLYAGVEEKISDNEMHSIKIITRDKSERICRSAFDFAVQNGRKKVTCIHKANIMKLTDGLFLDVFYEVAKDYPGIEAKDMIVDACCMNLVLDPSKFDVMVTENLYGDIITDLTSGLIGGVGLMPSANIGTDMAMFEAVHGSAPDIAGKNIANPTAFIWSACMMLDHIGLNSYADVIREAIKNVMDEGVHTTKDIGGSASTTEYTDAVINEIKKIMSQAA